MDIKWVNPLAYCDDDTKEIFPIIENLPTVNIDGDIVTMWKRGNEDVAGVRIGSPLHWALTNDGWKARRKGSES